MSCSQPMNWLSKKSNWVISFSNGLYSGHQVYQLKLFSDWNLCPRNYFKFRRLIWAEIDEGYVCRSERFHSTGSASPPPRHGAGRSHRGGEISVQNEDISALQKEGTVQKISVQQRQVDAPKDKRCWYQKIGGLDCNEFYFQIQCFGSFCDCVMTSKVRYSSIPRDHDRNFFSRLGQL